jgi:hypothetical protein
MTTSPMQQWRDAQSFRGNNVVSQSEDYGIAVDDKQDDYCFLYDTLDGHQIRVPLADKQYMLAKVRPVKEGERAVWVQIPGQQGLIHHAPGGSTPAYSETLPAELPDKTESLAATPGVKSSRGRKRGKRGKRRGR